MSEAVETKWSRSLPFPDLWLRGKLFYQDIRRKRLIKTLNPEGFVCFCGKGHSHVKSTASGGSAYEPQLWFNHLKSCKFISEPDAEQLVDRDIQTDNSERRTEDCQMARAMTKENGDAIASK
ncbi:hypothetical protein QFC20_007807 [Naganishia adeliensis]|uniref:Uncharacterized protein n=1 Tax=Naganishia adeliensis TaxID=92952 RepID=A0ACC2UVQ9_9TREE|nr:hypothetical protein QFC20_007807 [Naganishia adeliensis]